MSNLIDNWNKNRFSIYDSEEKTVLELLDKYGKVLNNNVDNTDKAMNVLKWLEEEGLPDETRKVMNELLESGKIDDIIDNFALNVQNQINTSVQKDIINFSQYGKNISDINDRFESVVKYASENNLRLFIDQDIELTRTVTLYDNTHLISNRFKYKIYTNVGTSLNAINLIDCYNIKNVVIDNVKFENTGFGSSGSEGINGLFDGFGVGLSFGNCSNIEVKNCEFFKCGGYNFSEGSAMLWFSCCHYAIARNNYFHLGDNAITVDRWYASAPSNSNAYNYGILIEGNTIEHISGRGICIENINDKGNIIVSNNIVTDYGIAGVEGRSFTDTIISNNIFNGDLNVRINPKDFYGLNEVGWNWSTQIQTAPKYGIQLISGGDRQVISNNIIKNLSSQAITLGDMTNCLIIGNRIEGCTNHAIYGKPTTSNATGFICTGNTIKDSGFGVKITTDNNSIKCENVNITGNNIFANTESISLENCNKVNITGNNLITNTGNYGVYISKSDNIKFDSMLICETTGTKTSTGIYLSNCNNVVLDGTISDFTTLLGGTTVNNLVGNCNFRNGVNALSVDTTFTGDGRGFKYQNITGNIKTKGNNFKVILYLDTTPTTALGYFTVGDLVYFNNPVTTGYLMTVCKTSGNGGVWSNLIPIS